MGAGLALEAFRRYPRCAADYKAALGAQHWGTRIGEPLYLHVCDRAGPPCRLVFLATKIQPWLPSHPDLIARGLAELAAWAADMNDDAFRTDVYLPLLGSGLGRLPRALVRPLFARYCRPDYFHLVIRPEEVTIEDVDAWEVPH